MGKPTAQPILPRIREALKAAGEIALSFVRGTVAASQKSGGRGPVTEADRAVNRLLRGMLVRDGEGWLSEESADDFERLKKSHVWIVDPIDGTLEFLAGIPEWCISIGWVEHGRAVAGGVYNPLSGEMFLGSIETGATCNAQPVRVTDRTTLAHALVLASRSEVKRGEWDVFQSGPLVVRPAGSIAYKLALVAAGKADATWTLSPKNEWDFAAGVALVESAGGFVRSLEGTPLTFNRKTTLVSGLIAGGEGLRENILRLLSEPRGAVPAVVQGTPHA